MKWTAPSLKVPITFGAWAFMNATAPEDATLVAKAREAGVIILGKANLNVRLAVPDPETILKTTGTQLIQERTLPC